MCIFHKWSKNEFFDNEEEVWVGYKKVKKIKSKWRRMCIKCGKRKEGYADTSNGF